MPLLQMQVTSPSELRSCLTCLLGANGTYHSPRLPLLFKLYPRGRLQEGRDRTRSIHPLHQALSWGGLHDA